MAGIFCGFLTIGFEMEKMRTLAFEIRGIKAGDPQLILAVISDERCLTKARERKPGRWLENPPNYKIEY